MSEPHMIYYDLHKKLLKEERLKTLDEVLGILEKTYITHWDVEPLREVGCCDCCEVAAKSLSIKIDEIKKLKDK